ncbi:MAG: hypothetical protein AB7V45_15240 [Candidatus Krumholzibacteriia bacterium]
MIAKILGIEKLKRLKDGSTHGVMRLRRQQKPCPRKPSFMRSSKAQILSRVHTVPAIRFTDQTLTPASGLVLFQVLFDRLELRTRVRRACRHVLGAADFKLPELLLTGECLRGPFCRTGRQVEPPNTGHRHQRQGPGVLPLVTLSGKIKKMLNFSGKYSQ